jgi:hypothetical protein
MPDYSEYRDRPVEFIREVLNYALTDEMETVCRSVVENVATYALGGHSVGKTNVIALLALWNNIAREGETILVAPTARQYSGILLKEKQRILYTSSVPLQETGWHHLLNASDENRIAGINDENLLVAVDEGCAIDTDKWDCLEAVATGINNRIVAIGRPHLKQKDRFQDAIRIPVWTHPNVNWAYELHPDGVHQLKPEVKDLICTEKGLVRDRCDWPDDKAILKTIPVKGAISVEWIENIARPKGENSEFWQNRLNAEFL